MRFLAHIYRVCIYALLAASMFTGCADRSTVRVAYQMPGAGEVSLEVRR